MRRFITAQAALHPAIQPRDALKLCYQAAYGAEHLLSDQAAARDYLRRELLSCPADANAPLAEAVSPDTCRVNLSAWKAADLPEEWLWGMFLRSCEPRADGDERFREAAETIGAAAAQGELPFSWTDWEAEWQAYRAGALGPVHHSEGYRAAEHPAYRVVSYRYVRALALLAGLDLSCRQIIALDGRCASGKTTLAKDAEELFGASAVHMDDFYLPLALRTEERLGTPGGNVHYERFLTDVIPALRQGGAFSYPVFDCSVMDIRGQRSVADSALVIVEGAYSCHPALGDYMTLRAFSDIEPEEQQRRILLRNGEAGLRQFNARWIPLEEKYIAALRIRERAQIILPARACAGYTLCR